MTKLNNKFKIHIYINKDNTLCDLDICPGMAYIFLLDLYQESSDTKLDICQDCISELKKWINKYAVDN